MKSHHLGGGGWRWGIQKPTGTESDTELQHLAEMENLDLIPSIYSDTGVDYACEVRRSTSSRGPGEDFCTPVFTSEVSASGQVHITERRQCP